VELHRIILSTLTLIFANPAPLLPPAILSLREYVPTLTQGGLMEELMGNNFVDGSGREEYKYTIVFNELCKTQYGSYLIQKYLMEGPH